MYREALWRYNDIFRNIEAWRKNIVTEKANQNKDEQATAEEKKDLPKFDSTTDRDKTNTNVSQTSSIFENSTTHVLAKEVNSEFTHTFPLSRSPTPKNEFTGSFKRLTSSQCPTCGGLSCRPTAEGVDGVDCHCREHRRSRSTWPALGRLLHRRMRYRNIFR
ncbi:hypothetical protein ALC57_09253 [Trachymyrmex cornetzi]|uniref:Uncharacterized protein n=1 Tax=Trachymyrmex cornetzi TaxID=471704 RepID=A0A151J5R4_9HYME|nr:hypothetical protein ALC57_09253 [Trachymyrmex cornetzi]